MSKTLVDKQTYKREHEPRTKKRKIEEQRAHEVNLPSRPQLAHISPEELDDSDHAHIV